MADKCRECGQAAVDGGLYCKKHELRGGTGHKKYDDDDNERKAGQSASEPGGKT